MHGQHLFDVVLFLGCHSDHTLAAASLCGIDRRGLTFDIAGVRHGNHTVVLFDQIL